MEKIFDSHAHYDDEKFDSDRTGILDGLFSDKICGIINCGCNLKSSLTSIMLSEKYSNIYAAVGVYPHDSPDVTDEDFKSIVELFKKEKVVAIGEIGLDYHYDYATKEMQLEFFEKQVKLSIEYDLPVIVHDREAHEDTLNILKKYKPKGVVHCFSGSAEFAKEIYKIGMYIGIGGAVTFKNAVKPIEVVREMPMDRYLLETDAPYMSPVPMRGKRCTSDFIEYTANKISEIKSISADEVIRSARENTFRLFNLK